MFERDWSLAALVPQLAARRAAGNRLVLTCGCFDILHVGHVRYLRQARILGDALIVALNCDATVRRLKGPCRPVNPADERAEVLAGLSAVDHVVISDESTVDRIIEAVRPAVFVTGGDNATNRHCEADLVESLGGRVATVGPTRGRSTTMLVQRLASLHLPRPSSLARTFPPAY